MMPTIRISDELMNVLKEHAEPFTDTPESALRRIFEKYGLLPKPVSTPTSAEKEATSDLDNEQTRARGLTPQPVYEKFLLHVLATRFKGKGEKHDVTKAVVAAMRAHGFHSSADTERVSTGETKAENTVAWARNALKERGLISRTSRRGSWELTPKGLKDGASAVLPQYGD